MHDLSAPLAILDTNLLVRSFIRPSDLTARLMAALMARRFRLVTSEPLLDELRTTLYYPRLQKYGPFSERDLERVERVLRRLSLVMPGYLSDVDKVPTDVKDNIVIACALEAGADYVVTDDRRDLLPLKQVSMAGYRTVQILRPKAFLRLLDRELQDRQGGRR